MGAVLQWYIETRHLAWYPPTRIALSYTHLIHRTKPTVRLSDKSRITFRAYFHTPQICETIIGRQDSLALVASEETSLPFVWQGRLSPALNTSRAASQYGEGVVGSRGPMAREGSRAMMLRKRNSATPRVAPCLPTRRPDRAPVHPLSLYLVRARTAHGWAETWYISRFEVALKRTSLAVVE